MAAQAQCRVAHDQRASERARKADHPRRQWLPCLRCRVLGAVDHLICQDLDVVIPLPVEQR
jgi:hypothetical protein